MWGGLELPDSERYTLVWESKVHYPPSSTWNDVEGAAHIQKHGIACGAGAALCGVAGHGVGAPKVHL